MDAAAAVPNLHRRRAGADLDALTDERVWRAVEPAVEVDVIVDVDTRRGALGGNEAARRQRLSAPAGRYSRKRSDGSLSRGLRGRAGMIAVS
jgi:hypothetical protein